VSQSSPVVLASGRLTRSGDSLSVELVQPDSMPAVVRIVCRRNPQSPNPHTKRLPRWRQQWSARWRRRRRNAPRRPGTADDPCRRALLAIELTDAATATQDRAPAPRSYRPYVLEVTPVMAASRIGRGTPEPRACRVGRWRSWIGIVRPP
jgi:hypothetical protein